MNVLQKIPFERNNYYKSMLLTEKDLLDEQIYLNDKRFLINRFLHGIGVASGLTIVQIDDNNISLESGLR